MNIDDGYLSLMDEDNETRDDLKVPEGDIGKEIVTRFEKDEQFMCTVLKAMDQEAVIAIKAIPK